MEEDTSRYPGVGPWRSAVRRQQNVRVALVFWALNTLVVVTDVIERTLPLV